MTKGHLKSATQEINYLEKKLDYLDKKKRESTEMKATKAREEYHRAKSQRLENMLLMASPDTSLEDAVPLAENAALKEEIKQLKADNDELRDRINTLEDDTITLFDVNKRHYTPATQRAVGLYTLLQHHVGTEHVGPVINAILHLADKKADRFPSKSVYRQWHESSTIGNQSGSALPSIQNLTLQSD